MNQSLSPHAQRLANKMMQIMKVTSLPVRAKNRYDYVQDTYIVKNGKRSFDKGNIVRLANFLIASGECKTKSESFSKAWSLAKGRKAQFVSTKISDYSFWTKGD